jgi:protein gp37
LQGIGVLTSSLRCLLDVESKNTTDGTFIFTCSQSDFWHEGVDLEKLDEALDVIDFTPWNTYLMLTKRPALAIRRLAALRRRWPANAWWGVTCGHPKSLPLLKPLRRIEAEKKFLSVEALLSPMVPGLDLPDIDWVIGGGESGPKARPCLVDWARALRDFTVGQGIPFFWKQWGVRENNPTQWEEELDPFAKGGATLDGKLWREFPVWQPVATIATPQFYLDSRLGPPLAHALGPSPLPGVAPAS